MVLRARLVMGDEWPQGLRGDVSGGESPLDPYSREVMGGSGRFIVLVERLLSFRRLQAFDATVDVAEKLVATLRGLAGDDAWDDFRLEVRAFAPE